MAGDRHGDRRRRLKDRHIFLGKYCIHMLLLWICNILLRAAVWGPILNHHQPKNSIREVQSYCNREINKFYYLKHCNTHDSLDPKKYWLEVSKKVKHDPVPQGASKLQDAKVGSYWKFYFCAVNKVLQNLTDYNPDFTWSSSSCFIFLETSNQDLLGSRLSWVLQHYKRLPGHAEKSYFT